MSQLELGCNDAAPEADHNPVPAWYRGRVFRAHGAPECGE
jgi:hypothetical protein